MSVAPATQREVQEFDEFTARLEAPDTVDVRARVAGTVEAVRFKEGQVVRKGDPLFTIDARAFKAEVARAEAQVAAVKTQADLARADLARSEKLVAVNAVSQQEIDQLRATLRSAEANLKSAEAALVQARLNVEYATITAPVTGRTSRANVTPGNLVGVGDPVLTNIVSSDKVYAYFDASEATYLKYMRAAKPASASVQMGLSNEQGFPHTGKLDFVDNRLNPATASIPVRAVFDNKNGLLSNGVFGVGRIRGKLAAGTDIGTGEVWGGRDAMRLGIIDELSTFEQVMQDRWPGLQTHDFGPRATGLPFATAASELVLSARTVPTEFDL